MAFPMMQLPIEVLKHIAHILTNEIERDAEVTRQRRLQTLHRKGVERALFGVDAVVYIPEARQQQVSQSLTAAQWRLQRWGFFVRGGHSHGTPQQYCRMILGSHLFVTPGTEMLASAEERANAVGITHDIMYSETAWHVQILRELGEYANTRFKTSQGGLRFPCAQITQVKCALQYIILRRLTALKPENGSGHFDEILAVQENLYFYNSSQ
jgi:hypothetical protein